MNGVHDMGGMHGMGPIQCERNEPVFRFTTAAKRQSPVTVEFDFVDPIARRHRANELRFHRLDKVTAIGFQCLCPFSW
jgi:hypothetical protein